MPITVCHFPTGLQQVEPHRASPVQPHLDELARQAADQPPGDHQPDRRDHDPQRPESSARIDDHEYPKAIKVSDAELAAVNLTGHHFHPEWNYTISPSTATSTPPASAADQPAQRTHT